MTVLLEAQNVTKTYGGAWLDRTMTVALENLSLAIDDAQPSVTVIAGESGSGKTTLANLLLGVIEPTAGQIRYRGKDLTQMSRAEHTIFRREVQAIFQDPFESYNPFHKVDRVLATPLRKFGLGTTQSERQRIIEEALELVGLHPKETLGRYPHQLSGGQRQRIMVARALLLQPRVIIADEPVSMVDASLRATILESLLKLNQELGISIVYITHDLTTAYQVGDSILVLYQGSITELGDVELVIKEPQHPYTQLLVDSIPIANPAQRWGNRDMTVTAEEGSSTPVAGCKFVARCPHAMAHCSQTPPPVYLTSARRGAACYLYESSPSISGQEIPAMISSIAIENRAVANASI